MKTRHHSDFKPILNYWLRISLARFRQPRPKQLMGKLLCVERDQRINIALSAHRPVRHDAKDQDRHACNIPPDAENRRQHQIDDAHEFQRVPHFQAVLGVVRHRHERHIEHHFGVELLAFLT